MNFADYFVRGLRNTLRLKKGVNWSVKGTEIPIPTDTVIDTWFVGEFSSAVYEVVAEYGKNDVEHVNVKIAARPEQASIIVSGRNNNGRDLVNFSATVDASKVILTASPFYQDDGVTPLEHVKITFKVTYYERLTPTYIPTIDGESLSSGGELGVLSNWKNTNVPDGFMAIAENGTVGISNIGIVQVPGQTELAADFILAKLNIVNSDNSISIGTTVDTLSFSLDNIANLNVTHLFDADTTLVSSIDNTNIGATTAVAGTFTDLTATGAVSIVSNNQQISLAPSGTGTVTINPATNGTIDNTTIGATNAKAGTVLDLTISANSTFASNNQSINISPAGTTGTIIVNPINPGSINNMTIGATIASTGKFTSITVLSASTQGNQLITLSQLKAILLGAAV